MPVWVWVKYTWVHKSKDDTPSYVHSTSLSWVCVYNQIPIRDERACVVLRNRLQSKVPTYYTSL